jgi:imidazolonepropionase
VEFVGTRLDFEKRFGETPEDALSRGEYERVDAGMGCVLPGFVDSHTHLVFAGTRERELEMKLEGRSYMDILEAGGGILSTVRATREAGGDELKEICLGRLDAMLEHGTTTVEAKSGYGLTVEDELKCLRVLNDLEDHPVRVIPTFLGAHAVPPEYKGDPGGYMELVAGEMLDRVVSEGLARYCDVFCEEGVFDVEQSTHLLERAAGKGLSLRVHVDEFVDLDGAAMAARMGCHSADHLHSSNDAGLAAMNEAGVVANLLPGTPYALMDKEYPRARHMLDTGMEVAISTDLNPNCWCENMQFVVSLSCHYMAMKPMEALRAATLGGARSLRMGGELGVLAPGAAADLVVFDVPTPHHIPYMFGRNHVDKVIKDGTLVVDGGKRLGR